jgi:hypothetical protein
MTQPKMLRRWMRVTPEMFSKLTSEQRYMRTTTKSAQQRRMCVQPNSTAPMLNTSVRTQGRSLVWGIRTTAAPMVTASVATAFVISAGVDPVATFPSARRSAKMCVPSPGRWHVVYSSLVGPCFWMWHATKRHAFAAATYHWCPPRPALMCIWLLHIGWCFLQGSIVVQTLGLYSLGRHPMNCIKQSTLSAIAVTGVLTDDVLWPIMYGGRMC